MLTQIWEGMEKMYSSWDGKEHRRHKRFLASDRLFAVCKSYFVRLGRVVDMSESGLSFHYVSYSGDDKELMSGAFDLEVFEAASSQYFKGVECKIVYNSEVTRQSGLTDTYHLRRCGVEFGRLSEDQSEQLEYLISHFTISHA